jgi:hypothetical protein
VSVIRGTYVDGKIIPDMPPTWANGTRIVIEPEAEHPGVCGDDDQGDDPESITRWVAWYDSLKPLVLTPEDERRIEQARAEQKAFELATWEERSRKLEQIFE